ncbi:MAG: hypothetical protein EVB00_03015 [SAR86 cluster bacterium]|uniref:Uncharacterized protein n=1 Tax=SAR86 cluster bacterium TaxID=2030880 RepID=A0A520M5L7_9GAMM|nr:MAG: hypothetical protein EVB00_03015 [SAR86 cluster bacterium]
MKKLILSFLFLPSIVIGDHCDGGACPALEHIKDTGDEVAKDLLPYIGIGLILAVSMQSGSDQSSLSYINYDAQNRLNGIKVYGKNKYFSVNAFTRDYETFEYPSIYNYDLLKTSQSFNIIEFKINLN